MPRVPTVKPNGPAIRSIREDRRLTSDKLAKMCGSHRNGSSIRNLEIQDWRASKAFVQQVAKALGVKLSEIVIADEDETATAEKVGAAA